MYFWVIFFDKIKDFSICSFLNLEDWSFLTELFTVYLDPQMVICLGETLMSFASIAFPTINVLCFKSLMSSETIKICGLFTPCWTSAYSSSLRVFTSTVNPMLLLFPSKLLKVIEKLGTLLYSSLLSINSISVLKMRYQILILL